MFLDIPPKEIDKSHFLLVKNPYIYPDEVKTKIRNLKMPKQFFCRPILIHVNGVSDELLDSNYFSQVIEMAELFE